MMAEPKADSFSAPSVCKICGKFINNHLPEELEECTRKIQAQQLAKKNDLT